MHAGCRPKARGFVAEDNSGKANIFGVEVRSASPCPSLPLMGAIHARNPCPQAADCEILKG